MRAVHLHDAQAERVYCGAAPRVARTTPPYFAAGGASIEAEPMRTHLDGRLAALAQAVAKLSWEAGERKWQPQRRRRFARISATCN